MWAPKKLQKQCTCWQCSKTWVTLNYFLPSTMAGSVAYCHWWWSGLRRDGGDMSRSRRRTPGGPLPSLAPTQVTMVTQWPPYTLTSCQTGLGSTGSNQDTDLKLHLYFDLKIWISHRMRFLQGNNLLFETSTFVEWETRTLVPISTQAKYNI